MAHKVPGALSQNFQPLFSEIIDIVEPGLTQLTKVWENKLAKFSKPMRDEVFGRFYCVYEQTMDSAKGLEKLRKNQECDVLQDKFFEVVSDVEASNKILMKFKQNLPAKDILEAITGLSAKGRERISKELNKKNIADAKKSELEVAFENTFGKMDPQSHRLRHLFVLENIQNENRGMSYVEEHLSHLDPTFAKDIRRILKRDFHCESKKTTLKQYNDAARTLIQELKNPKKSGSEKTKKDPEIEKLNPLDTSEKAPSSSSSSSSSTSSEKTPALISPEPEAEAKPKFDAAKEISRYDTQIQRLELVIAKKGETNLIDPNDQVDNKTEEDLDVVFREEFDTNIALADEKQMVEAAEIVVERYRFEIQVAILRDIVQKDGKAKDLLAKISPSTISELEAILKNLGTDYLNCSQPQLAKAAKIYLDMIEKKKMKAQKDFQTSMNTLTNLIELNGYANLNDDLPETCELHLNKIVKDKYGISSWTDAHASQTCDAAKILLCKYLMRTNPQYKGWHEEGSKCLKKIITAYGKMSWYPDDIVLKNLDAILMDRYGVVLQKYCHLNDDSQVLAAAKILLKRYNAVQGAVPVEKSEESLSEELSE